MDYQFTQFISFDIETTGLNALEHNIIEIAAVKFHINGDVIDSFNSLIDFKGEMTHDVIKIHGITKDMLVGAPPILKVLKDFTEYIEDYPLIAHNAVFDAGFIGYNLNILGLAIPENNIFDTLNLSRKIFKSLPKFSLGYLKSHFNIPIERSHRALDDSLATMSIFKIIIQEHYKNNIFSLKKLSKINPPITFNNVTKDKIHAFKDQIMMINHALNLQLDLILTYNDKQNNMTNRTICPSGVFMTNGSVYLDGFCYLRQEDRRFKLDRILNLELME